MLWSACWVRDSAFVFAWLGRPWQGSSRMAIASRVESGAGAGRDERVRRLFDEAMDLAGIERTEFLTRLRAKDPEVCGEVEELLSLSQTDAPFFDSGARNLAGIIIGKDTREKFPMALGKHTLLRQVGEGGMGVVYEATEEFPNRTVALKLVRPEVTTPNLIRRLTHEAAVLAKLRHPGIAQLFEAGFVNDKYGRRVPYLSMEFVEGRSLSRYLREEKPTLEKRLELLALLCDAVDHAHRRGIVHRDLKPGNVLVTSEGQPKVLDFGIARLTEEHSGITVITGTNQLVGTLSYMSPEQLTGQTQHIDSRCDVYALGVIAYEALAGRQPIEVDGLSVAASVMRVQTVEPTLLGKIDRAWRGDVEAIVAKALEKDPARRYQSASELAADLRRHLHDEPVTAARQTTTYQIRKLIRRNKAGAAAAVVALVSVIAGGAVALWNANEARQAAKTSQNIGLFLKDVLSSPSPENGEGRDVSVRALLERRAPTIDERFAGDDETRRELHAVTARTFYGLGNDEQAAEHYAKALQLLPRATLDQQRQAIAWTVDRARSLHRADRWNDAEPLLRDALAKATELFGQSSPEVAYVEVWLGAVLNRQCLFPESLAMLTRAHQALLASVGPDDSRTVVAKVRLAERESSAGRDYERRTRISLEAFEAAKRVLGPAHPDTLIAATLRWNSEAWMAKSSPESVATPLDQVNFKASQAVDQLGLVLGPDHPETIRAKLAHMHMLVTAGDFAAGLRYLEELHTSNVRTLGRDHIQTLMMSLKRAGLLERVGRLQEAEAAVLEAISALERREQPSFILMEGYYVAGRIVSERGRLREARDWYMRSVDFVRRTKKGSLEGACQAMCAAGLVAFDMGEVDTALEDWRVALRAAAPETPTSTMRAEWSALKGRLETLERTRPAEVAEIRGLMEAVPSGTYEKARQGSLALMARAEAYVKGRVGN